MSGVIRAPGESGDVTIVVSERHLRWLQQRQIVRKQCASCKRYHTDVPASQIHALVKEWQDANKP